MKGHLHLNVRGMAVKARDLIESIQALYSVLCHLPSYPPPLHHVNLDYVKLFNLVKLSNNSVCTKFEKEYLYKIGMAPSFAMANIWKPSLIRNDDD